MFDQNKNHSVEGLTLNSDRTRELGLRSGKREWPGGRFLIKQTHLSFRDDKM
jgi:hypothetical protein